MTIHWGLKTRNDRSVQETEQYLYSFFYLWSATQSNCPKRGYISRRVTHLLALWRKNTFFLVLPPPISQMDHWHSIYNLSLGLRRHAHGPLAKRLTHMAHLSGNTSGVSKSSLDWLNYTGFPGDVCVAFFNVPPGNKNAVAPNPLTKEESRHVYNCDNERLSGSTKCWI